MEKHLITLLFPILNLTTLQIFRILLKNILQLSWF